MSPRSRAVNRAVRAATRVVSGLAIVLMLASCDRGAGRGDAPTRPLELGPGGLAGVELVGVARGPLRGLGPQVDIHAFVRSDGSIRADLDHVPEDGRPVRETLIWTSEIAILFDRVGLSFNDLGDSVGELDALGGHFRVADAVWLLCGRSVAPTADSAEWAPRGDEWRGRSREMGRRGPNSPLPAWAELVWRDDGEIRTLSRRSEEFAEVHEVDFPRSLSIEGATLEAPLVVRWDVVRPFTALGDSILDPGWEPSRP